MSADFDVVTEVLGAVAQAWGELAGRLQEVARVVAELERGVRNLRGPAAERSRRPGPGSHRGRDPGAAGSPRARPDEVVSLESRAQRLQAMAEEADQERRGNDAKLDAADRTVGVGLEKLAACRAQVGLWSEKILVPDSTTEALDGLGRELERLRLECTQARSLGIGAPVDELRRRGADSATK